MPGAHLAHAADPSTVLKVPEAHVVQATAAVWEYVPTTHALQKGAPAEEKVPEVQLMQAADAIAPVFTWYRPAAQLVQETDPAPPVLAE